MKILHTEASNGWGGQEIRMLREAIGLRDRGYEISFAVETNGKLIERARAEGFDVTEMSFERRDSLKTIPILRKLIKNQKIDIVNTHSSLDAWLAGFTARTCRTRVMRTRHLSTRIRAGFNSVALYRWLADGVVTTCEEVAHIIRAQAKRSDDDVKSIPTGIDPTVITETREDGMAFRRKFGIPTDAIVVGTLSILRSGKRISDLITAADLLRDKENLRWLIVGDGPGKEKHQREARDKGLEGKVLFTGQVSPPYAAVQAMDIFAMVSQAEAVSQSCLQASYLGLPLITTRTGGLFEVCQNHVNGYAVDVRAPDQIAEAVIKLANDKRERAKMGEAGRRLVEKRFLWESTLDGMEEMLHRVMAKGHS